MEETFKTHINQQVQKFYEQSRITQALNAQQDGKDDDEEDETDGAGDDSADQKAVGADKTENEGMQASLQAKKDKKSSQKQKIIMYKEYLEQRAHR